MSQPEAKLVPFPKASASHTAGPSKPRDPRLDVFRGLALVMIFINHVPGNPYEDYTNRNFGFSDAAEAFFMLSGMAAGLAYSGRFMQAQRRTGSLWAAIQPMWSRAWTLYMTQILLTAWAIAIFSAGALWFGVPEMITKINLTRVFGNTAEALVGIPTLGHQLGYVNILPAYSVLLITAPIAILVGLRSPALMMALSVAFWFLTGLYRWNIPAFPNPGGWFFNPLAWQVLFVAGLMTGLSKRQGKQFIPYKPLLFWGAICFLLFVLAWMKIPPLGKGMNQLMLMAGRAGAPFHLVAHDKTFVGLPRMLHVMALTYVLAHAGIVLRLCAQNWTKPLALMGRQGLLVFATGTLMSLTGQVILNATDHTEWLTWTLPLVGVALMILIAWVAEAISLKPKKPQGLIAPAPEPAFDTLGTAAQTTPRA
mgnify:CR=1 FL=1